MDYDDEVTKLLTLSPKELEKMDKEEVHEGYKKIMKRMLFDFFLDSNKFFNDLPDDQISVKDIMDFVSSWTEDHFKPPHPDWKAGMTINQNS